MWGRTEPLLTGDGENRSRFCYPHHWHDAERHSLESVNLLSTSHPDRLAPDYGSRSMLLRPVPAGP